MFGMSSRHTMAVAPWTLMTRTRSPGRYFSVAVEGPRGPQLPVDLDEAVVGVHLLQHGGLRALDRLDAERRLARLERGALVLAR